MGKLKIRKKVLGTNIFRKNGLGIYFLSKNGVGIYFFWKNGLGKMVGNHPSFFTFVFTIFFFKDLLDGNSGAAESK